jgi:predicted ATPase/DNA-binding SARP family transcriptional activator
LLGPVECVVAGQSLALGRVQERCVLAVLLLDLGRVVSVGRLVELLWDVEPPASAQSLVHTHVSRLRATLREAGAEQYGVRLLTRGSGYTIEAPSDAVDVYRFRQLVMDSRQTIDPVARSAGLREALALWRGPAVADATTSRIREQIRAGLDEQRLAALEDRVEADLAVGRHQELVAELTDLVAQYPLRERLVGLLMLALYRSGQQSRALVTYRRTRQLLIDDLGIEPGGDLRRMEQAVLTQDPALDPPTGGGSVPHPPPPTAWTGPRSHLTTIVGRQSELATLTALLQSHRLVTVVGVGGVGKTTLALHAAEAVAPKLPSDVAVAMLASVRDEEEVVFAIGALLGVSGASVAETLDGVERVIRERAHLLVLDNCEHLVTACVRVMRRLLSASPRLMVLATSRVPLGLPEETVWRLEPLQVPPDDSPPAASVPSVALFLRRADESVPGFAPTSEDLSAIGRICRRVDGLPLALELAASRLRALPAHRLADHLERDFGVLSTGADAPSPLVATLDWSYRLLGRREQLLFARLSVFRGGFDITAAERVCGAAPLAPDQVLPTVAALVDRSLIQPYNANGVCRYRLLEVVRDYAGARLAELEADGRIEDRHLDHWLDTARAIAQRPRFYEQLRGWIALDDDIDNLRAAAEYGYARRRTADVVELTTLLFDFWVGSSSYRHAELERWFERAAPYFPDCRPEVRCLAVFHCVCLLGLRDDNIGALKLLRPALPELRTHRYDDYLEARTTEVRMLTRLLDPAALSRGAEVLAMVQAATDPHYQLHGAAMYAEALITWGRYDEAAELCARYPLTDSAASPADVIRFLAMRCLAAIGRGDFVAAAADEALLREQRSKQGNFLHVAASALPRALLALVTEPPARARSVVARIVADLDERYPPTMSWAYSFRILWAEAARRLGHLDQALRVLTDGLDHGVTSSDYTKTMPGVVIAALLATDLGDAAVGEELIRDWDAVRHRLGLPAPLGLAGVVASRLGPDTAVPVRPAAGHQSNDQDLRGLVSRAHEWCVTRRTADASPIAATALYTPTKPGLP